MLKLPEEQMLLPLSIAPETDDGLTLRRAWRSQLRITARIPR